MRKFDNSFNWGKYILPVSDDSSDSSQRKVVSNLFHYLDDFMNTLGLVLGRLDADDEKVFAMANRKLVSFEERFCLTTLWADYYFFVNTVERTYRLSRQLYKELGEPEKENAIKTSRTSDGIRKFRNGIEHLYEKTAKSDKSFYNQHREMGPDREITIDGFSFKADESSLEPLYQIYDDISNIIERKYVIPNKEIVDRLGLK